MNQSIHLLLATSRGPGILFHSGRLLQHVAEILFRLLVFRVVDDQRHGARDVTEQVAAKHQIRDGEFELFRWKQNYHEVSASTKKLHAKRQGVQMIIFVVCFQRLTKNQRLTQLHFGK